MGGPLAAAWAIVHALGREGFAELAAQTREATLALLETIDGIEGLRVVGEPTGPLFSVASDDAVPAERRVDPHVWADAAKGEGWILQTQPGLVQADGSHLPHTTHLTVTPVTASVLDELQPALVRAADAVRAITAPRERVRVEVLNAASKLDKAAENGLIHRNNASRRKSRLMKRLNAAAAE